MLGRLWSLDMGALMSGASYKGTSDSAPARPSRIFARFLRPNRRISFLFTGQYEERIKSVIDECEKAENNVILFIDEVRTLG